MEFEGLNFVTVKSRALGGRADVTLFAPAEIAEGAEKKNIPLVILLHGVYGSHWAWAVKGGAHRTTQRMVSAGEIPPMALAMPSDGLFADGSGYVPHATRDFEKWILDEVPAAARTNLKCVSEKSPVFLCGLSMGGFGALRIGAKHPEWFAGMSAHSAITRFEELQPFVEEDLERFGVKTEDRSVLEVMTRSRVALPPFRFDCGTADSLLENNRRLHRELTACGIAHDYEEFAGGHDWTYWAKHLEDSLQFFGAILRK